MSVLIVDGISGVGKSTYISKLKKDIVEEHSNYSQLFISEHFTDRYFENKSSNDTDLQNHTLQILKNVERFVDLQQNTKFKDDNRIFNCIIERLFLSSFPHDSFFENNLELLRKLNIKHIMLYMPKDMIRQRINKTLQERNSRWKDYINSLGGIDKAIEYFYNQQQDMLEYNKVLSKYIETEIVDVSKEN